MKRRTVLLALCCCAVFLLTACGKVSKMEKAIEQIGTVTLESHQSIEQAEEQFLALSAKEQARVDNSNVLILARQEWNRLDGLVEDACKTIDSIGEVTEGSLELVVAARSAYETALGEGLGAYITNYSVLQNAEEQFAKILLEKAGKYLSQRKYEEAYEQYVFILERYYETSAFQGAVEGKARSLIGLAEKLYNAGKLEEAMYAVEDMERSCGSTEESGALYEKILKRLEQQRPKSGKTFKNTVGWGQGEFTVSAGLSDACVKLENLTDSSKYILFYIRAGEKATVKVKDGSYIVKYATGNYWYNQDSMFGEGTVCSKADDVMTFTTTQEGSYIYYSSIEITLYQVTGGNLDTVYLNTEDF